MEIGVMLSKRLNLYNNNYYFDSFRYYQSGSVDVDMFVVECRSRLQTGSAFDTYAAEAFSEKPQFVVVVVIVGGGLI